MRELLIFGGWIFWSVFVIYFIIMVSLSSDRQNGVIAWPIVATLILMIAIYYSNTAAIIKFFNTPHLILFALLYVVVGTIWSFFKWLKFVKRKYKETKSLSSFADKTAEELTKFIPVAAEYREMISYWIFFWPFSMVRYIIGNLLFDFGNAIQRAFAKVYNNIAKSQFKD